MRMSLHERVLHNFSESVRAANAAAEIVVPAIVTAADVMTQALLSDRKILVCGNGGSAAQAVHFSSEMLNRFETERPGLPAIALSADSSTLTSIANDYRFDDVFAKQVLALGQGGDVLMVLTTSGNSLNILRAVEAARDREMLCVALGGRDGGQLVGLLTDQDVHILVPGPSTARIQEVHMIVIHCLCDLIDAQLLGQA